jgi:hypothetical protein
MTDDRQHPPQDRPPREEHAAPPGDVERVGHRFGRGDAVDRHDREASTAFGGKIRELTAGIEAPPRLRARVEEARARPGRRWLALPAVAVATVAAAAVAIALVVGGGAAGPTVDDAAALALARPTQPAPAVNASDAQLVDARVANLTFPNYAYASGTWKAVGRRTDTLDGRAATTVTYRGPLGDVGYTIVDGDALPEPGDGQARWVERGGLRLAVLRRGDATVVTWRRGGHTCVLAGRTRPGMEERLLSFATWA